jgi:hypothetical protein
MQPSDVLDIELPPFDQAHLAERELVHVDMDVEVGAVLELLATELRHLWATALQGGNVAQVTRLVEASHAVHRAEVALTPDSLV